MAGGRAGDAKRDVDIVQPDQFQIDEALENIATRELTKETLEAASRELLGEVVKLRPGGGAFDHVMKVEQAQAGLRDLITRFSNALADTERTGRLGKRAVAQVRRALNEALELLKESEKYVPKDK